uniref:Late embryogenesis abundant protein LEA-2 subgroup domain-containing protein n=1 Tax=Noccaea caerulescens TaxID=107243 RepID=A0A1J3K320_NOCCA
MHAKTDSEVTSLAASSPARSPRRPVYYVQSPSRDSHDGEKTATSFHSTPVLSPMGSPPHSQSSMGRHSRESSSSRFSGSLKPGSRKVNPNDGSKRKGHGGEKQWKECAVIEEEGLLDDGERDGGVPRRCYVLAFIVGFFVLFGFFSLILYGAAKPQKPKITVKSITFETLKVQAGQDAGGVGTDMITMNATLRMLYRNTGTFFGVHVTSTPIDLSFSQIKIGSGSLKKFYQSRKSQRTVLVHVIGEKIPLYGSGSTLIPPAPPAPLPKPKKKKGVPVVVPLPPAPPAPVPMRLSFVVRSRAYVLGRLVQPKFYKKIECDINFEHKNLNKHIAITKNCTVTTV